MLEGGLKEFSLEENSINETGKGISSICYF
jgi:hypothetical protein